MSTTRWPDIRCTTLLAAGLLASCASPDRGPVTTEPRGVDVFHSIDLRTAADLEVRVGPATSLAITADAATLKNVRSRVQNGMLVIEHDGLWFGMQRPGGIDIRVTLPELKSLAVNGAGDVDIEGMAGDELTLVLQGAGNIDADGVVDMLTARINGAGNVDLSDLVARDATVTVNGAGNLEAHATEALNATVNGVGTIRYKGRPANVQTSINGVGSISPE